MRCPVSHQGDDEQRSRRAVTPLSPVGLQRHGASRCVAAPRRCYGIACVASPGIWSHGASNATVSTSTTDC